MSKYILLTQHRSGSAYVYDFMNEHNFIYNKMEPLGEFFFKYGIPISLPDKLMYMPLSPLTQDGFHKNSDVWELKQLHNVSENINSEEFNHLEFIKKKLKLLKEYNSSDYTIKLMASDWYLYTDFFKNELLPFFENYTFIILHRNLWDTFISWEVQQNIEWSNPHGKSDTDTSITEILKPFKISLNSVLEIINKNEKAQELYRDVKNSYKCVDMYYEELSDSYLNNFFELKDGPKTQSTWPLKTDYRPYIINYNDLWETFKTLK